MKKTNNLRRISHLLLTFFLITFIITGCATIRQPTVDLSAEIGLRVNEMQELHLLAIQKYFDMEVAKVEDFLQNEWEPLFLKNFLATSNILGMIQNVKHFDPDKGPMVEALKNYLDDPSEAEIAIDKLALRINDARKTEESTVKSLLGNYVEDDRLDAAVLHIMSLLGTDSPAQLILEFAEAAHDEMSLQRQLMMGPIEKARKEVEAELTVAYADIIRGQSTLTGRLQAAAKLTEEKERIQEALGVKDLADDIKVKLGNFSSAVDSALGAVKNTIGDVENMEEGEILNALPGAIFSDTINNLMDNSSSSSNSNQ